MMAEEKADHLQASKKIWESVAHTLKGIAERHGWENNGNADLGRIAGYLTALSGDKEIDKGFNSASAFHRNFYEDEFELDRIEEGALKAAATIKRLRKAAAQYDEGTLPSNGAPNPTDYYALLRQGHPQRRRARRELA